MQRYENLVYTNNGVNDGVNGQQIDAIHMGYRQTGAVYTRRSGSVQIQPDRPPISVRARIGSNSIVNVDYLCWHALGLPYQLKHWYRHRITAPTCTSALFISADLMIYFCDNKLCAAIYAFLPCSQTKRLHEQYMIYFVHKVHFLSAITVHTKSMT